MSRDYRPVKVFKGRPTFVDVESFNVNSWGTDFWGRVFQLLGIPVSEEKLPGEEPLYTIQHEYAGPDLETVRRVIAQPDFKYKLTGAIKLILVEYKHPQASDAAGWAEDAVQRFFKWFSDPVVVAVASDYCTQYFALLEKRLNYEI